MNAEDRRLLIEETLEALNQRLTNLGLTPQDRTPQNRNHEDKTLRVDVDEFTGQSLNPEEYLDWESSVENYFEYRDTQEDQKFKVAKVKLTKLAATWLEGIQRQRVREGKPKINTWEKLKKTLRRKYVPSNYTQQLSMQWSTLSQGNRTVAQYIQEWERLSVLCDVRDSEDMRVGKFLGGLREDLRIKLTTIPHLTVALAGEQAMLLEQYSKRRGTQASHQPLTKPNLPMHEKNVHPTISQPSTHTDQKGKSITPIKEVVCFKCHGHGHFKANCPNNRAFTLAEWDEIRNKERPKTILVSINGREEERGTVTREEDPDGTYIIKDTGEVAQYTSDSESDRELLYPEESRPRALVSRKILHSTSKQPKSDQRENLFQTKCKVKNTLCDLIIDSGSETNCVSHDLVKGLQLRTQAHPHPYQLQWVDNKASTPVSKQCLITLGIGSYQDKILCDVVNMNACHILLGRPWQHDKRVSHDGFTNTYTFRHKDKVKTLVPLPPHRAIPPSNNKQLMHLTINKSLHKTHCCANSVLTTPLTKSSESNRYRTKGPKSLESKIRPQKGVQHSTSQGLSRQRQNNLSAVDWKHWKGTKGPKQTRQPLSINKSEKHTGKMHQVDKAGPPTTPKHRELRTILFKEGEFAPNIGAGLLGLHDPLHKLPWGNPKIRDKHSNKAQKSKGKAIKAKQPAQDSQTVPSKQLTLLYLPRSTQRDPGPMKAGNDILGLQRLSPNSETKGCIAKKAQEPVVKVTQSAGGTGQVRAGLIPMLTSRPRLTWWEQMAWTNEPPRAKVESWHYKPSIKPLTQQAQTMQGHQKHERRSPA